MKRAHAMPFGAVLRPGGGARFRLWAPSAQRVDLVLDGGPSAGESPMRGQPGGWFEFDVVGAAAGQRYGFRIDGDLVVPDPASRANPDDVHGRSLLVDPLAFEWTDDRWPGRPWHEAVVYELHVGCFTPQGTLAAVVDRLDDLVALGVTAIELMPVADFPGQRGWGYDGVLPFAPEAGYGTPEDLKRLVCAAHARGLMVLLDVVYNHFGPDGNYLHVYAKPFFNPHVPTPWGAAINLDGEHSRTVRDFFIHNALYWIEEFHLDGLRLDAVHAMHDTSAQHFVDELAQAVRNGPGRQRHVHVVLENDLNDARRLARAPDGRPALADAQWNDDVHHTLHVIVTAETDGYYTDFADEPLALFARALAEGFAYQGQPSRYRHGETRGSPSTGLPPTAFVNSTQTHDQVGNRAFGERLVALAPGDRQQDALRALTACVLLAPSPPMLFMGEEFAASAPFLYFCDFSGELARAVTEGRRAEFGRFSRFADPRVRERIPDPNDERTFLASKLDWSERGQSPHADWLALYARLLHCRSSVLVPWLDDARCGSFTISTPGTLHLVWPLAGGRRWHLLAQLADHAGPADLRAALPGDIVYSSHGGVQALQPWSVLAALQSR